LNGIYINNEIPSFLTNPIKLESWLDYFQDLWSEQSETLRKKGSSNYTEPIVEEELDNVLKKKLKIRKHQERMDLIWIYLNMLGNYLIDSF
jgi:hypothetical protein